MRISGTEPSSVILSQKRSLKQKLKSDARKVPKQVKKGWCNKPTILQFQSILTQQILMLSKRGTRGCILMEK